MSILKIGEQILTIHDAPYEDDAFRYSPNYSDWVKIILNKEMKQTKEQPDEAYRRACL